MIANRIRNHPFRLAAVAGTLVAAAFALSAPRAGAATVYACAKHSGGTLRIVARNARCHRGEHKLAWGTTAQTGPAGKEGPQGKEGQQGKEGPAGHNGLSGAVAGYSASSSSLVPFTGAFEVTVLEKTIPAGSYIVLAKTAIFSEAKALVRAGAFCELRDEGSMLDTSPWSQWLVSYGASYSAETALPLQAAMSTKSTSTLSIVCSDTSADEMGQTIGAYNAQIEAIQTSQNS